MLPALRHPGFAGQQRRLPGTGSPSLVLVQRKPTGRKAAGEEREGSDRSDRP
jgi:hypothetical protein